MVPSSPLISHFALDALCDHLVAVSKGQIDRLIINVPPGMAKSSIVAVLWPIWEWTWRPIIQWLFATYTKSLTFRDAGRRRDLIKNPWYQARWGNVFQITKEGVEFLINDHAGHMYSTSTGGTTTGWRGDRLVLDDPQDPKGAESEVKRQTTIDWLTREWPTRVNRGSKFNAQVLIQQRLHELDATGLYLKNQGWVHLKIPLEYKGERVITPIYEEPRTEPDEIISEDIYPRESAEDLKRTLGPYGTAGQLQQEPAPTEGGIIKAKWFREYEPIVKDGRLVAIGLDGRQFQIADAIRFSTVDPAVTEKEAGEKKTADPDFTAIGAWACWGIYHHGRAVPLIALLDVVHDRLEGPDIPGKMDMLHRIWNFAVIGVETIGFAKSVFQHARRQGLPVREINTSNDPEALFKMDKDKVARALAATVLMADGRFALPTYAPWLAEYRKELLFFPNAAHDDYVDMTSSATAIAERLPVHQSVYSGYERVQHAGENVQQPDPTRDMMGGYNPTMRRGNQLPPGYGQRR